MVKRVFNLKQMKKLIFLIAFFCSLVCLKTTFANDKTVISDSLFVTAASNYCANANSLAFIVWQDGKITKEAYWKGTTSTTPLLTASGTKSFNGPMAMIAVQDGLISLDEKVANAITEWQTDPLKKEITYRQLLNQTSGLRPAGTGAAASWPAWADLVGLPMLGKPGDQFRYGANHFNVFGYALQRKLNGKMTTEEYYKTKLFDKIGIKVTWRLRSADNNPQLGGGAVLSALDWLSFGKLIYQHGRWNGKQIIDSALLSECFKPTQPQNPAYGLSWWLKEPVSAQQIAGNSMLKQLAPFLNATWIPEDLFFAAGAGKQLLYIIPSKKAIVVRMGPLTGSSAFDTIEFLNLLLRGFK